MPNNISYLVEFLYKYDIAKGTSELPLKPFEEGGCLIYILRKEAEGFDVLPPCEQISCEVCKGNLIHLLEEGEW